MRAFVGLLKHALDQLGVAHIAKPEEILPLEVSRHLGLALFTQLPVVMQGAEYRLASGLPAVLGYEIASPSLCEISALGIGWGKEGSSCARRYSRLPKWCP